jgi:PilZ domain
VVQREHERVAVDAFVKIKGNKREFVFRTRDLSRAGLFLYTRVGHLYPFEVGAELEIELYDFDGAVELGGVIVRVVQPASPEALKFPLGFGIRITHIKEVDVPRFDDLIARAKRGENPY